MIFGKSESEGRLSLTLLQQDLRDLHDLKNKTAW